MPSFARVVRLISYTEPSSQNTFKLTGLSNVTRFYFVELFEFPYILQLLCLFTFSLNSNFGKYNAIKDSLYLIRQRISSFLTLVDRI